MNWHFRLVLAFIFVAQLWCLTHGKRFDFFHNNPFANPETTEAFTRSFVQNIAQSHDFGNQTVQDIEDIVGNLVTAVKESSHGHAESQSQIKAMTMAFASSIAELIVSENSQEMNIEMKTRMVSKALADAFRETTGEVNKDFIHQVRMLVELFSLESGETDSEAEPDIEMMPIGEFMGIENMPSPEAILNMERPFNIGKMVPDTLGAEKFSGQNEMMNLPQFMPRENYMQENTHSPGKGGMLLGAPAPKAEKRSKDSEPSQFESPDFMKGTEMFFNSPNMWSGGQLQGFSQPFDGQNMPMEIEGMIPDPYLWPHNMFASEQYGGQPMMFMPGDRSLMERSKEKLPFGLQAPPGMDLSPSEIEYFMLGEMPPKLSDDSHLQKITDRRRSDNTRITTTPKQNHATGSGELLGAPAPSMPEYTKAPMGYGDFISMEMNRIEPFQFQERMPGPYSWNYGMTPQMDHPELQPFMFMRGDRQPTDGREFMGVHMPPMANIKRMEMNPEEIAPFMQPRIPFIENKNTDMNPEENQLVNSRTKHPRRHKHKKSPTTSKKAQNEQSFASTEPAVSKQDLGKAIKPDDKDSSNNLLGAPAPEPTTPESTSVDLGKGVKQTTPMDNDNNNDEIEVDEDITVYVSGKPVGEKEIKDYFTRPSMQQSASTPKENTTPATTASTSSSTQITTQTSPVPTSTSSSPISSGSSGTPGSTSSNGSSMTTSATTPVNTPTTGSTPSSPVSGGSSETPKSASSGGSSTTSGASSPAGGSSGTPSSTTCKSSLMSSATPVSKPPGDQLLKDPAPSNIDTSATMSASTIASTPTIPNIELGEDLTLYVKGQKFGNSHFGIDFPQDRQSGENNNPMMRMPAPQFRKKFRMNNLQDKTPKKDLPSSDTNSNNYNQHPSGQLLGAPAPSSADISTTTSASTIAGTPTIPNIELGEDLTLYVKGKKFGNSHFGIDFPQDQKSGENGNPMMGMPAPQFKNRFQMNSLQDETPKDLLSGVTNSNNPNQHPSGQLLGAPAPSSPETSTSKPSTFKPSTSESDWFSNIDVHHPVEMWGMPRSDYPGDFPMSHFPGDFEMPFFPYQYYMPFYDYPMMGEPFLGEPAPEHFDYDNSNPEGMTKTSISSSGPLLRAPSPSKSDTSTSKPDIKRHFNGNPPHPVGKGQVPQSNYPDESEMLFFPGQYNAPLDSSKISPSNYPRDFDMFYFPYNYYFPESDYPMMEQPHPGAPGFMPYYKVNEHSTPKDKTVTSPSRSNGPTSKDVPNKKNLLRAPTPELNESEQPNKPGEDNLGAPAPTDLGSTSTQRVPEMASVSEGSMPISNMIQTLTQELSSDYTNPDLQEFSMVISKLFNSINQGKNDDSTCCNMKEILLEALFAAIQYIAKISAK